MKIMNNYENTNNGSDDYTLDVDETYHFITIYNRI